MARRERLRFKDVQTGAGDLLFPQTVHQGRFVEQGPPRRVHQDGAGLQHRQSWPAEEMARLGGGTKMERDDVRRPQQLVELDVAEAQRVGQPGARVERPGHHLQA